MYVSFNTNEFYIYIYIYLLRLYPNNPKKIYIYKIDAILVLLILNISYDSVYGSNIHHLQKMLECED